MTLQRAEMASALHLAFLSFAWALTLDTTLWFAAFGAWVVSSAVVWVATGDSPPT